MIPGEVFPKDGSLTLNAGQEAITLMVANQGDRPVQVGSHYHFGEANPSLNFDREAARGMRLDIAAGTAVPAAISSRMPRAASLSKLSAGLASPK